MTQYLIIGAGILGASTAYHLAKAGRDVTLVDHENNGEATRAAAGIISPWLSQKRNETLYDIIKYGAAYYSKIMNQLKEIGITETSYAQVGSLHLHKSDDKLAKMVEDVEARREEAPEIGEVTQLTDEQVPQAVPVMSDRMGAVKIGGGGRVNGAVLRQALLQGAQHFGAKVIKGYAQLNADGKRVAVSGETFHPEQIIVTNGAWAQQLLQTCGVEFPVTSTKTQIIYLSMPEEQTGKWPVVMLPNNKYIVGFDGGRIAVGAEHEANDDFNPNIKAKSAFDILKIAFKFAPGLEPADMIETRVGFRPQVSQNQPVFGFLPDQPHIYVANGLGASGITSGPFLGSEIAKQLIGESLTLNPDLYKV
ncbi:D-amino-acid dehydrogenase [Alkalibacillus filiformis]|uniref:D-amino-acid dehydrogenase n=1 Tax=Alkalibacillus filiformis TaxID=200990 RepID=A0ABU0DP34_9BACI|nr:FAD-binding oxidoreductase [Alkalibacillus filiformis]MDQ0350227.1 D-amino-acid dehydrogenase [Alkalibacillus filiformis]